MFARPTRPRSKTDHMKILRIVPNVATSRVAEAARFYGEFLGLECCMDLGWIATYGSPEKMMPQISFASEGGSGTEVPDISIEVDDLDEAIERAKRFGYTIVYGPIAEPWGIRRFYIHDPFGKLVNIVAHA
jgi:catechol 2,3-dioxygenase-like lactoylglutathione lyase family enzyme